MNRYERMNAAHKVDGYYNPPSSPSSPSNTFRTPDEAFDAAKEECIAHMRKSLSDLEHLSYPEFIDGRAGK